MLDISNNLLIQYGLIHGSSTLSFILPVTYTGSAILVTQQWSPEGAGAASNTSTAYIRNGSTIDIKWSTGGERLVTFITIGY